MSSPGGEEQPLLVLFNVKKNEIIFQQNARVVSSIANYTQTRSGTGVL